MHLQYIQTMSFILVYRVFFHLIQLQDASKGLEVHVGQNAESCTTIQEHIKMHVYGRPSWHLSKILPCINFILIHGECFELKFMAQAAVMTTQADYKTLRVSRFPDLFIFFAAYLMGLNRTVHQNKLVEKLALLYSGFWYDVMDKEVKCHVGDGGSSGPLGCHGFICGHRRDGRTSFWCCRQDGRTGLWGRRWNGGPTL